MHTNAVARIMQAVQNVIADLELEVPLEADVVFEPGAVYNFFRRLNDIIQSAETSVFVIDPYLDDQVFDPAIYRDVKRT